MAGRKRATRTKKGSGAAGALLFLFLLAAAATGAAAWFVFLPAGPSSETFVEIASGSTSAQIAAQLEQSGIVRSRYAFDAVRLWKRGTLKAGEYRFDHPASVPEVYARIARGDVFTLSVTIPEGSNRFDIANRLKEAGLDQNGDFLAATISSAALVADLDLEAKSLEGYLFPDTYRFQRKATGAQIASAMVHRFRTQAAQIGLVQSQQSKTTQTSAANIHSIVTLASLVERETAVPNERSLVASVLSNRLAKGMPLMTDPAVIYGLETEGRWRGAIYQSDLLHDTPYNTYRHPGLPPGPIANPGLSALRAAMHPSNTSYLYFVAAGDNPQGHSLFSTTLEEHNRNVAIYRKAIKDASAQAAGGPKSR
ncbi:MAG TPA: endolytic transglycosylase MltG [Acidobacteriaceae bacterium]